VGGDFLNAINPFPIMELFVPDSVIFLTRSLVRTPDGLRDMGYREKRKKELTRGGFVIAGVDCFWGWWWLGR